MRNIILRIFFLITFLSSLLFAKAFVNETLHYTISYKWGLIHKDAGKATLRLTNSADTYRLLLTARTLPWADDMFMVRDTLKATVKKNGFRSQGYEKITHEGGKYAKDVIRFQHTGSVVKGTVDRVREKTRDNKTVGFDRSRRILTGNGPVFDMLSVFYYIRMINWHGMKVGQTTKMTIFSGSKSENLTIKYLGTETIKLRNKTRRPAYKLNFIFTQHGGKKSSDNISAWISTDANHIPLYLVGKLPIGQVRVYLDV
ncbi:MAG: DUF3108 domain-containing protein [Muribaculum sp.]|nr:DUF3108 domain-containing protein [Muribaculum sp.]